MARFTYDALADSLTKEFPTFTVCPPREEDEALTVYPPEAYYDDYGIDIFIQGTSVEMWMDGEKLKAPKSFPDADAAAKSAVATLEARQAWFVKEYEG